MAEVTKITLPPALPEVFYDLRLTPKEAGQLLEFLYAHVHLNGAFDDIRGALFNARVFRVPIQVETCGPGTVKITDL